MTHPDTSRFEAFAAQEFGANQLGAWEVGEYLNPEIVQAYKIWNASRADILALLGSDELVEKVASGILHAENGLDGDTIGTTIHENDRVMVRDNDKGFADLATVGNAAARAALAAITQMIKGDTK